MTVKTLELCDATKSLAEYAKQADFETTVVVEQGTPIAAVVSLTNTDLESISLSQNPQFVAILEHSRESIRTAGAIPSDEVRRRLGLPAKQVK